MQRPSPSSQPAHPWRGILLLILLCGIVGLCVGAMEPPLPSPASAPARAFSADRAFAHVQEIARAPHPPGTPEHTRVRDYIVGQFKQMGLDARVQEAVVAPDKDKRGNWLQAARVENIIARLPGQKSGQAVLLSAHYDSHPTGPGAGDDGAGIATLLETARALKAGRQLPRDIFFLVTDAEERGMLGAKGFVQSAPEAKQVACVLNFEARGGGGPVFMFETSSGNAGLIASYAQSSPSPLASSLMYNLYKQLPNDTDLTVFKDAGMPGLNFAFASQWTHYHSQLDTPQGLDKRSLQHEGDNALHLAHRLASSGPPTKAGDATYFDILSRWMVHYRQIWNWPLLGVTLFFLFSAVLRGRRADHYGPSLATGLILFPITLALSGALAFGLGMVIQPLRLQVPSRDPYDARVLEAACFALVVGLVWACWGLLPTRFSGRGLLLGGLIWWGLILLAVAVALPGAAYLFTWPLLLCAIAACTNSHLVRLIAGLLSLVLTVPVVHGIALLLGFNMPLALGVLGALMTAPLIPLFRAAPRARIVAPLLLIIAGLAGVGFGWVRNTPSAARPRTDTLYYVWDADKSTARWATSDLKNDAWTQPLLGNQAKVVPGTEIFPWDSNLYRVAGAPRSPLDTPTVTRSGRSITIRSRRGAQEIVIAGKGITSASLAGKPLALQNDAPFCLRFLAPPADGITLELDAPKGTVLTIDDYTVALPKSVPQRPAGLIPQPFNPAPDQSIARARFTL